MDAELMERLSAADHSDVVSCDVLYERGGAVLASLRTEQGTLYELVWRDVASSQAVIEAINLVPDAAVDAGSEYFPTSPLPERWRQAWWLPRPSLRVVR